ncbi:hypothetical protein, unlikely [Trypanosoma brucei gambiense DAL972]|uniref:Uncharacterized protein n=1 Tax=Trypanosoma brucei gambiense (strain MHOM/CI/86/DAL972) TaxID=679716 RepID=C9ZJG2_TRYB9|nr:hypothetical protein, unlikely [Trypanosoma brucei gambiense DAL972]CBH09521.1 hypothetical protein, unlikely [Trypanosoma brucei gambiense DAL972]|eukprot:XP_011771826.1 hypothetical protein, unlikely [Trypanosoma brucei gambiense DAL972]
MGERRRKKSKSNNSRNKSLFIGLYVCYVVFFAQLYCAHVGSPFMCFLHSVLLYYSTLISTFFVFVVWERWKEICCGAPRVLFYFFLVIFSQPSISLAPLCCVCLI